MLLNPIGGTPVQPVPHALNVFVREALAGHSLTRLVKQVTDARNSGSLPDWAAEDIARELDVQGNHRRGAVGLRLLKAAAAIRGQTLHVAVVKERWAKEGNPPSPFGLRRVNPRLLHREGDNRLKDKSWVRGQLAREMHRLPRRMEHPPAMAYHLPEVSVAPDFDISRTQAMELMGRRANPAGVCLICRRPYNRKREGEVTTVVYSPAGQPHTLAFCRSCAGGESPEAGQRFDKAVDAFLKRHPGWTEERPNPDLPWHRHQREEYHGRLVGDLAAHHGQGAEFWQGALSAEDRSVAREMGERMKRQGNPKSLQAWELGVVGPNGTFNFMEPRKRTHSRKTRDQWLRGDDAHGRIRAAWELWDDGNHEGSAHTASGREVPLRVGNPNWHQYAPGDTMFSGSELLAPRSGFEIVPVDPATGSRWDWEIRATFYAGRRPYTEVEYYSGPRQGAESLARSILDRLAARHGREGNPPSPFGLRRVNPRRYTKKEEGKRRGFLAVAAGTLGMGMLSGAGSKLGGALVNPEKATRVIFRRWLGAPRTVVALFPDVKVDAAGHIGSYEHLGQHGAADYLHMLRVTAPVTLADVERQALQRELEGLGYRLKIEHASARDCRQAGRKPNPGNRFYWLRIGDASPYEQLDTLDQAIEFLKEMGVGPLQHWVQRYRGFTAPGYEGHNYVSLYVGDDNGEYINRLSLMEMDRVTAALRRKVNPTPRQGFKTFHGASPDRTRRVKVPQGWPTKLWMLGRLKLLILKSGRRISGGTVCAASGNRIYIVNANYTGRLSPGERATQIEYVTPSVSERAGPVWFHPFDSPPPVRETAHGFLKLAGKGIELTRQGIVG